MTEHAVQFTWAGAWRGVRAATPIMLGMIPFGIICGVLAQGLGLSLAEIILMSAFVFAGSAELVVMGIWTHPPDLLAVTLATFVVNLRMALMGPVLAPWLDRMRGWRLWGSLFVMVDQSWALSVGEINAGKQDAGYLMGSGLAFWTMWVAMSVVGFVVGAVIRPPAGHPVFFAALAVFVSLLVVMWRGKTQILPWVVAAGVSTAVSYLLPGTFWYIVAGAVAGSVVAGVRDHQTS